MNNTDIHEQLANHLSHLAMGFPNRIGLLDILKACYSEEEAEIALAIPSKEIPFKGTTAKDISKSVNIPLELLEKKLEDLSIRGLLFSYKDKDTGIMNYALQQAGFGIPQVFFWKCEDTPFARDMVKNVLRYYTTDVTKETYSTNPIPFRFLPVDETIDIDTQTILPYQVMEEIIKEARVIGLGNCTCRFEMSLINHGCNHPLEVCMKFNELAEFLIDRGFAREITKEEALKVNKQASEAGLVHFSDNAIDNVQQNCNCCGCSCWNLGLISRRKIPRDELIATYFIRETNLDECTGCGSCVDICPPRAVEIIDDKAVVDNDWCIGCGVCLPKCPADAIKIVLRKDLEGKIPEESFKALQEKILKTRP